MQIRLKIWISFKLTYHFIPIQQKLIDPDNTFVHILTNEDCDKIIYQPEDMDEYVKDLERLNRNMKKLVYIDSQPISFWTAPDNGKIFIE